MDYNKIHISVIGLGYVGYPLFQLFSQKFDCIGLDNNSLLIQRLRLEESVTMHRSYVTDYLSISDCDVHIVTVPTPIDRNHLPDLSMLKAVCRDLARVMKIGCTIIFESTVAPGTTEETCIPLLEKYSGKKVNHDFYVGYSPERVNVGDHLHTTSNTAKIVSASSDSSLGIIKDLYSQVIDATIIEASSIKVAEASKMYENIQRDVLIALANEYSVYCKSEGIDINEVTECASSKWNFSKTNPGLVGGHCIGVDPYYVLERARMKGINLPIVKTARETNENAVVDCTKRFLRCVQKDIGESKSKSLLVLGFSYKKDVGDIRNTKVARFINLVSKEFASVDCYDPLVDSSAAMAEYKIPIATSKEQLKPHYDVCIKMLDHCCFNSLDIKADHFYSIDIFL